MICDGRKMFSCSSVGGETCAGNEVTKCSNDLVFSSDKKSCSKCALGRKYVTDHCEECAANSLCYGNETEVFCGEANL